MPRGDLCLYHAYNALPLPVYTVNDTTSGRPLVGRGWWPCQYPSLLSNYTSDGKITPRALLGRLRCLSLQEEEKKNKEKKMLEVTTKLAVK